MTVKAGTARVGALLLTLTGILNAGSTISLAVRQQAPDPDTGLAIIDATGQSDKAVFALTVDFACVAPWEPGRLFISIADTAFSRDLDQLASPGEIRLGVPVRQVRSLLAPDVCASRANLESRPLLLRNQLSAFTTLSCRNGEDQSQAMTVSTPLDLLIQCAAPPDDTANTAAG